MKPGIVFQSSVAPHVRETVLALQSRHRLAAFCTALHTGHFPLYPWIRPLMPGNFQRIFQRHIPGLPHHLLRTNPWWEIARLGIPAPASLRDNLSDLAWERGDLAFAKWVARIIPDPCGFLYGYDHSSLEAFRAARLRGIPRIYELSSPEWGRVQSLNHEEMARLGLARDAFMRLCEERQPRRVARCLEEWDLADLIIVNSEVTRRSFAEAGHPMDKVRVVPLGAPPIQHRNPWPERNTGTGRVRLLWVGPFSPRKGARVLKEAMALSTWPQEIDIHVYGSVSSQAVAHACASPHIHWHGPQPQQVVWKAMAGADALLLPTLADGFGMAITEAWSHGLPVLTTDQAGAAELMTPGVHGLRFTANDPAALASALVEFLDRRTEWPTWSAACQQLAAENSWLIYHQRLVQTMEAVLQPAPSLAS